MTYQLERELTRAFRRADLPLAPDRLRQVLLQLPEPGAFPGSTAVAPVAAAERRIRMPSRFLGLAAALAPVAIVGTGLSFGAGWLQHALDQSPPEWYLSSARC